MNNTICENQAVENKTHHNYQYLKRQLDKAKTETRITEVLHGHQHTEPN